MGHLRRLPFFPGFDKTIVPIVATLVALAVTPVLAQAPVAPAPTAPAVSSPAVSSAPSTPKQPSAPQAAPASPSPTASTPAGPVSDVDKPTTEAPSASAPKAVAGTGSALIPHDLSPWGMFLSADIVVKAVMIGLSLASLVTWTVLLAKTIELTGARSHAARALWHLAGAATLRDASALLDKPDAPVSRFVAAALAETDRSGGLSNEGIKDRAAALLSRIEARAGRMMARGTGVLATIGSVAPFVGLFGTVWGIMNAFIGISKTNTTNLAVVAPGIAEALLATAFGLVAAIPAVIIYNMFARSITGYRSLLGDASTEVMRLLSRDLDRLDSSARRSPIGQAAE